MQAPPLRQLRLQFSLRLVLLVMAVLGIALGLAVYRKPTHGRTTAEQVSRIRFGMTEYQVISVLGAPLHRFESVPSLRWILDDPRIHAFASRDIRFLDIVFDASGKVVEIDEAGRPRQRLLRPAPSVSTQASPAR